MQTDENLNSGSMDHLAQAFEDNREGLTGAVRAILGYQAEAIEVLQESYLRACRALARGSKPRDLKAWIFVIVMNVARDERRRGMRKHGTMSLEETELTIQDHKMRPASSQLETQEAESAARLAIHRLNEKEREVFLLRVSGDLKFDAVAAALQIPVGTAKTRMRRALLQLREALSEYAPQDGRINS